ncbi:hypothetical protein I316_02332 [Kwoniella heveanensis BCC8398]|uniref:HIT-type domain-containing protein n=1 Tax=Kwoniella heveanensis BCC8398 TaxID=1296120 RepID=A0A1B9GXV1_9TREE|nr:hypothetical protein I316_02332 [Kwoniella heveanensis BCC8398]
MPPPNRKQPSRTSVVGVPSNSALLSQANGVSQSSTSTTHSKHYDALMDFQARRVQRRLEDLERTNPTDIPAQSFIPANSGLSTSTSQTHLSGSTIPNAGKKKMSSNVRRVLYGRKGVKDWLDELPSTPTPPHLTSTAPPPNRPPRKLCSSCGYKGAYKCPKCGEFSCGMECAEVHRRDGGCGV